MTRSLNNVPVLVVGAGIMGAGIAQVAAQAGHAVFLFDAREGAAALARDKLAATLEGLVAKGKLTSDAAGATVARIMPVTTLQQAASARLVVEAIIEQLAAKQQLLRELEAVVSEDAVLATNTSSISVTAIANGLKHPQRCVGMHFFNPVPLMKLVEVVSGLATDTQVARAVFELSQAWGKVPVHASSTPGFIVNRIARPYYAETLALLQERAASPNVLDACLKAAGFRMGPCELMDLIGHDTNFSVTASVYEANFCDKRYVPSLVQRNLVDGGLLGRKTGQGFYRYPEGPAAPAVATLPAPQTAAPIVVHGEGAVATHAAETVARLKGVALGDVVRERGSDWTGLAVGNARLMLTDGRPAHEVAATTGVADVALFDRPVALVAGSAQDSASGSTLPLAYAVHARAGAAWHAEAAAWLQALGFAPMPLQDAPGLVVARTLAMLINEAADAVQQGVCTLAGADAAMKLGVNYPAGPFEWLRQWSSPDVIRVIEALDAAYRGERYRVSPRLRRGHAAVNEGEAA